MTTKINKRSPKWYGWLPDLPDHRDSYSAIAPKVVRLPPKVDLRAKCSPVEDQGQLGSCTANSLVGVGVSREERWRRLCRSQPPVRLLQRTGNRRHADQDSGAFIRDGIKSLAKQGVCPEGQWPYVVDKTTFKKKPSAACYTAAKNTKSRLIIGSMSSARCASVSRMVSSFVFRIFSSDDAFESSAVAKSGVR